MPYINLTDDVEKKYYYWFKLNNYKINKKNGVFEDEKYVKKWSEYCNKIIDISWKTSHDILNEYVDAHGHFPTSKFNKRIHVWMKKQINLYKKGKLSEYNNKKICEFMNKYSDYFTITLKSQWVTRANKILSKIKEKKIKTSDIKWLYNQKQYYKKKEHIMSQLGVRKIWISIYYEMKDIINGLLIDEGYDVINSEDEYSLSDIKDSDIKISSSKKK